MKKFVNKIVTLDNIEQWAERDSLVRETVSQHSFKVASIAAFVLEKIGANLSEIKAWSRFTYCVLKYAILHDFDESIIRRDISHVVKYNSHNGENIREALNDFVEFELKKLNLEFVNSVNPDVKCFVKMCDWFAMLTFIERNKKMGCNDFLPEEKYCLEKAAESVNVVKFMLKEKFSDVNLEIFNNIITNFYYEK